MDYTVREIRIRERVHRVLIAAHPEGGVQLFCGKIPQSPVWAASEEEGLELMKEVLNRLSRGEDIVDMVLPGGPVGRFPG